MISVFLIHRPTLPGERGPERAFILFLVTHAFIFARL